MKGTSSLIEKKQQSFSIVNGKHAPSPHGYSVTCIVGI